MAVHVGLKAHAKDFPAYYERDYESASRLNELHEKLEVANALFMLDSASDAITAGTCKAQNVAYEADYDLLSSFVSSKGTSGLTATDRAKYQNLERAEANSWQAYETCFDQQIRRPVFANTLPPGVNSYQDAVTIYDQLLNTYPGELQEGYLAAHVSQLEAQVEEIEQEKNYIAHVTSVFRDVSLKRVGVASPMSVSNGTELLPGDIIITGSRGRATFELYDRIESRNAGPTVVSVGSDTEVRIADFNFKRHVTLRRNGIAEHELQRQSLVEIISGYIRAYTKGFSAQAAFRVRTGTSLCGIRGTDIDFFYDPDADFVEYRLYEGVVDISTPGGNVNLSAGNGLRVRGGLPSNPEPLDDSRS